MSFLSSDLICMRITDNDNEGVSNAFFSQSQADLVRLPENRSMLFPFRRLNRDSIVFQLLWMQVKLNWTGFQRETDRSVSLLTFLISFCSFLPCTLILLSPHEIHTTRHKIVERWLKMTFSHFACFWTDKEPEHLTTVSKHPYHFWHFSSHLSRKTKVTHFGIIQCRSWSGSLVW